MNLDFSPGEARFREEVRDWLSENKPREARPPEGVAMREFDMHWQQTLYREGWAGISWPTDYGGRGLSTVEQLIWYEESARAAMPDFRTLFVGLNHGGPTLIAEGTEAQKSEFLPPILRGEVIWCQGFSEPGSGSDLASLQTRAEIDGDDLVVNGQKIWTSYAELCEFQELLVRTGAGTKRSAGITWVVCDMRTPGITVQPIRMIHGHHLLAQVFYDDVRIPIRNVVGAIDQGWKFTQATLAFERGTAFIEDQVTLAREIDELIERWRSAHRAGEGGLGGKDFERPLSLLRAETAALRAMTYASISANERRGTPGPEGSLIKLYYSELKKRFHALAVDMVAERAIVMNDDWTRPFLYALSTSIGGGTNEIQKNIIAERMLGLPRGR